MTGISRRSLVATTGLAAAGLVLPGCSGSEAGPAEAGRAAEVTFLTGFGYVSGESYAFVADAKGFFAEENLKVTIKPGQAGESNMQLLRGGQAQFANIEYAGIIIRASKGEFDGVHCISVQAQKTTNALMALASSGIRNARDLRGKRVGVIPGSAPKLLWPAYADLVVPPMTEDEISSVKFVDAPGNQLATLLAAGKLDAIGQFVPGQPTVEAAAKGAPITVLPYGDYMTDMYGAVLVARDDVDADVKRRFAKAHFRGLQYTVNNPDEAAQIISKASNGLTKAEVAAKELRLLKPYVGSPKATPEVVARSVALMQGIGAVPATVPPERIFDFTVATDPKQSE
jgi:NitT/TauT family transport system substrate-binding protein